MLNDIHAIFITSVVLIGLPACTTLTEQEREQIAYDLNEARAIYEERRHACLAQNGSMVTESLTGAKRLSLSEMQWAFCRL